jgi:hypothetical protein
MYFMSLTFLLILSVLTSSAMRLWTPVLPYISVSGFLLQCIHKKAHESHKIHYVPVSRGVSLWMLIFESRIELFTVCSVVCV